MTVTVANRPDALRGALVLFEGLPPTVIDSQVLAHVNLVRQALGIDITVVAVACSQAIYDMSLKRLETARALSGGQVHLLRGIRPALPGSLLINRVRLTRFFAGLDRFSFIQSRGDYAAAVVGPWARSRGIPPLWDCRGDSQAELEERLGKDQVMSFRYRSFLLARELAIAGDECAAALFVTEQLQALRAPCMPHGQPSWVIPCLAPEEEFFFDADLRRATRSSLGIADDEAVYIYSGSLVSYQRFDETVALFREALARGQKARLIVLTPEVEQARRFCTDFPPDALIVKSVPYSAVNGYLNAADFGILLRDTNPVNFVAFPTKFAEYAMSGLKIVMKDAPPACVAVGQSIGNVVSLGHSAQTASADERIEQARKSVLRLGRRASMPTYGAIYRHLVYGDVPVGADAMSQAATS